MIPGTPTMMVLEVGGAATVQDLGRPGWAHLGVTRSGATDRFSHALANRLVGNPEHAATIEVTLGGLALRFDRPVLVAVAGAACPLIVQGGPPLAVGARGSLPAGAILRWGTPASGLRSYLAVRGGVDAAMVLGSRSTDTLSGLGPSPLQPGDVLSVGEDPGTPLDAEFAPITALADGDVRLWPGPRQSAVAALSRAQWMVRPDSDRVAVRLSSPDAPVPPTPLAASEPLIAGAVQQPQSGEVIVFLADHPTTGGYPVIAVVDPDDLGRLAQARPGDIVRLRPRA